MAYELFRADSILYPGIYTASFVEDCRDAALWAYYGCNHAGVCLQFRIDAENDRDYLTLERATGMGASGTINSFRPHPLSKVQYSNKWPEVDFFRSIGTLPAPIVNKYWLFSPNGERSTCAHTILDDTDAWRKDYWDVFDRFGNTKLIDWKHEKEQRILIHGHSSDLANPASRKLKYRFNSLSGIVFGMKTPAEQRIEIHKIIHNKCKIEGRKEFKFFQTYYSPESKKLELAELDLLNIRNQ